MAEKINIYEKLQTVRVQLQGMNLKKTGENKFAKYTYYELGDFLPTINKLFMESKLFSQVTFTAEEAVLRVIDIEQPGDAIAFYSPMASANLKGCHDIQNLGAVQTYQRRYLYMTALEIVEHDALDAVTGKADNAPRKPTPGPKKDDPATEKAAPPPSGGHTISDAQQKRMFAIAQGNKDAAKAALEEFGYASSKEVTKTDYDNVCTEIEKKLKESA